MTLVEKDIKKKERFILNEGRGRKVEVLKDEELKWMNHKLVQPMGLEIEANAEVPKLQFLKWPLAPKVNQSPQTLILKCLTLQQK